jgi:hypothetical protein
MGCCGGYCGRCKGGQKLVLGLLILLNAFWWPVWNGVDGWIAFFGVLFVVKGLLKLIMPSCGHETCEMPEKGKKKK